MPLSPHKPVVIAIGHSVRALVEAFSRANVECIAVDHFGDADTREFANGKWHELCLTDKKTLTEQLQRTLQTLASENRQSGSEPVFVLAGGMENLGAAVEQLRKMACVAGPTELQRRKLRDIEFMNEVASACDLQVPRFWRTDPPDAIDLLWKPYLSAGGLQVRHADSDTEAKEPGYWQEWIEGDQVGATCVVDDVGCQLLGFTGSFEASEWPGPTEFIYRGSWGPIPLGQQSTKRIEALANAIRNQVGYRGWLQFDLIRTEDEVYLLECNPRWTAGMEVLDYTNCISPIHHLLQRLPVDLPPPRNHHSPTYQYFAKAILYAEQEIQISEQMLRKMNQIEGLADRPFAAQRIERGHPIATVRARLPFDPTHRSSSEVRALLLGELRHQRAHVYRALNLAE